MIGGDNDTDDNFFVGVNDIAEKLFTGVNDTGN
jgi:hypothetical protein